MKNKECGKLEPCTFTTRLGIFLSYDKDGIIDDYICYMLEDLCKNLTELVVVVNGVLTAEGRLRLEKYTKNIFVRENKGFDAGAWKDAMISYIGWNTLSVYDEIILLNDSFYGPLYPFNVMFEEMKTHQVDFWGITDHAEQDVPINSKLYDHMPAHIQSYFTVFRKELHNSEVFKIYWENLPYFESLWETTCGHEVVVTQYFKDHGFSWEAYSSTLDLDGTYPNNQPVIPHCFADTYDLIKLYKCPIIKRHCFGFDYANHLNWASGLQLKKSIDYISKTTNYDVSLIYKNLLRQYNVADLFFNLHLQYILPKRSLTVKREIKSRAVMVFHISYLEKIDLIKPYICELPESVDVIITTKPKKNCAEISGIFEQLLGNRLRVLEAKDPGRDLSALLVTASAYLKEYDYIGYCHDKRSHEGEYITVGKTFQELIVENIIGSGAYVENIISFLDEHTDIGLLCPPHPCFSYFTDGIQNLGWCTDFDVTNALAKRLRLNANLSVDKMPLALGTSFWCRREALEPLFNYPWTFDDFPKEPLATDGTLNHALERIFPFVAQHQGYLTAWVMTDEYAAMEISNDRYLMNKKKQQMVAFQEIMSSSSIRDKELSKALDEALKMNALLVAQPQQVGLKGALINYFRKHTPKPFRRTARFMKRLLRW